MSAFAKRRIASFLAVGSVVAVLGWYKYSVRDLGTTKQAEVEAMVDRMPEMRPFVDKALQDRKLTLSEYKTIAERFSELVAQKTRNEDVPHD